MDERTVEALYPLAREVRRLFHRLAHSVTDLHRNSGISAGMRGVLESLVNDGPQSVPQLARQRPVSRQHIQVLVNDLIEAGLVGTQDNPGHKRSHLIAPTDRGRRVLGAMRETERAAFKQLGCAMDAPRIIAVTDVLRQLAEALDSPEWAEIVAEAAEAEEARP